MWKLVLQSVPVVIWCAAFVAVVRPLALSRRGTLFTSAAFAVALGKFAFFGLAGGDSFTPDLPPLAIWFYGWLYASAVMLVAAAIPFDIACRISALAKRGVSAKTKRMVFASLAVFAAAVSLWGVYEGAKIPVVKRVEIAYDDLPPSFDGYRIVHLSDLHCSTAARRTRFERIAGRVNSLDADLVAITGDFVDGTVADRLEDISPLADIRARDGVWGCAGNHERYWDWDGWECALRGLGVRILDGSAPAGCRVIRRDGGVWGCAGNHERYWDWDGWERALRGLGVRILDGSAPAGCRVIRRDGGAIAVGGLCDCAFSEIPGFVPDAGGAFDGAPEGAFRILLFHRPYTKATGSEKADVRLQLSGHTHGGAMPVVDWLVSSANEGHVRGLYMFAEGRYLHVSPGTGQWSGFPLRLFNPSEITEIVLRRKTEGEARKP
ncbi:MAG: metallophosphoesterase [Kiritimatiellae bacterium]|nr:metallophosphoesterase [Kiritimatiellia bacterium]